MLIIQRKTDESVLIGEDVEVMVVSIGRDTIRLGITAPEATHILRNELRDVPAPKRPEKGTPEALQQDLTKTVKALCSRSPRGDLPAVLGQAIRQALAGTFAETGWPTPESPLMEFYRGLTKQ